MLLFFCCCLVFKEWVKRNELIHPIKQLNYWKVIVGVTTKKMNLNSTTKKKENTFERNLSWLYLSEFTFLQSPESTHNLSSVSCDCFRVAFACFLFWTDGDTRPTAWFVICAKKSVHMQTLSPRWVCLLGLGEKAESRCSYIIMESLFPSRHPGSGMGLFII